MPDFGHVNENAGKFSVITVKKKNQFPLRLRTFSHSPFTLNSESNFLGLLNQIFTV